MEIPDLNKSDSNQASSASEQPTTILAYPQPPLQYINSIDPKNLPTPPPPIADGFYHMFGQKILIDDAIIAPLESQGTTTKRLYPRGEYDHKKELKKINASILVNFLDLVDVLVRCPDTEKRIEKCNDLATLFINFHHLINELRPHQARETLRVWLTCQKKSRNDIAQRLNKEMQKTMSILEEFKKHDIIGQQKLTQKKPIVSDETIEKASPKSSSPDPDEIMCDIIDECLM